MLSWGRGRFGDWVREESAEGGWVFWVLYLGWYYLLAICSLSMQRQCRSVFVDCGHCCEQIL